ncbi:hypothetical protein BAQ46_18555 [Bacillus paranthracis]|uniref:hypothetical protein n=1 Tax=Bacillus paranthracis TaxID=2026186 RepID=UPI0008FE0938|nr:hypothetical protein [Bacillus paranthracis]OJE21352.1 hypothetical protein BAQ46_18555 [Bacillus paranthracis]
MPSLTNRLKLALPLGNEYVNRAALNKIFEDIDRLVMLQCDFDTAKKEIDDNLAKKVAKSGDTMTGNLTLDGSAGERALSFKVGTGASDLIAMRNVLATNTFSLRDYRLGMDIWSWKDNVFTLHAQNTNLLKKTGDNMSGSLTMNSNINMNFPAATKARSIRWQQDNADYISMGTNNAGEFVVYDQANAKSIFVYYPTTNTFNLNAGITNLVKSTGDTITGLITTTDNIRFKAGGERNITWRDGNDTEYVKLYANSGGNRLGLWSTKNNKAVWEYHGDNDIFNVTADTNLLKKTGDTMSADLNFDVSSSTKALKSTKDGVRQIGFYFDPNGDVGLYNWADTKGVYKYFRDRNTLEILCETNVLKKSGDTATGEMTFRHNIQQQSSDGKNGIVSVINLSQTKWAVGPRVDGAVDWSKELSMSLVTGEVSVAGLKVKGERALTISDAEEKTPSRSGKDENGIFTTYEETQEDGKLWKRSVLSSPDADGNYLVRTVTYYKDGVAYKTKIFDLKYDEDGDFVKAVPR